MTWWRRALQRVAGYLSALASVTAVEVGRASDGLVSLEGAGGRLDPSWAERQEQMSDAVGAWRKNPLARRLVGLVTAFVVGDGIKLTSRSKALGKFLQDFANDPQNHLDLRQTVWCDTLSISGELFVTLHMNRANGMSYVRVMPAAVIDRVSSRPGGLRDGAVLPRDGDHGRPGLRERRADLAQPLAPGSRPGGRRRQHPAGDAALCGQPAGGLSARGERPGADPALAAALQPLAGRPGAAECGGAGLFVGGPGAGAAGGGQDGAVPAAARAGRGDRGGQGRGLAGGGAGPEGGGCLGRRAGDPLDGGGGGLGTSLVDVGEAADANLATAKAMAEQRARFMRAQQRPLATCWRRWRWWPTTGRCGWARCGVGSWGCTTS